MNEFNASRRTIIQGAVVAGVALMAARPAWSETPAKPVGRSSLEQPPLPFAQDALAPIISEKTIGFHYGKHHKGYFNKLAKAVEGTPLAETSLEDIILQSAENPAKKGLFNNAAQAWNHNFYWRSLTPKEIEPSGMLADSITRDFGSFDAFKTAFAETCDGQFGSGWGWLVKDGSTLKVVATADADTPFIHGLRPLLAIDVWEHAYYLDYQNRRADHVKAIIDKLLNWEFAEQNFAES